VRFGNNQRFNVYGSLTVDGTPGGSTLLSTAAGVNDWYGLRFFGSAVGDIAHCTLEQANIGIDALGGSADIDLVGATLRDGSTGVRASDGTVSLLNCSVVANQDYGIDITGGVVQFGTAASEWNDVYGNGDGNEGRQLRAGPADLTAAYVYWGTTDYTEIRTGITDEEDDPDRGLVTVIPYLDAAHDDVPTAVDDPDDPDGTGDPDGSLPSITAVYQNHPNPFNPFTNIHFDLAARARVSLEIYDVSGARVATLVDGIVAAGRHEIAWHGTDDAGRALASGVYLYRFRAGEVAELRRMTLVR
jgi:hypothetical protein